MMKGLPLEMICGLEITRHLVVFCVLRWPNLKMLIVKTSTKMYSHGDLVWRTKELGLRPSGTFSKITGN